MIFGSRGKLGRAGACAAGLAAALPAAAAEPAPPRFDIAAKPYADALIDLALQANVSLLGAETCPGRAKLGLHGRMPLEAALARLLEGSGCRFRIVEPRTVRILPPDRQEGAKGETAGRSGGPPAVAELLVTATKQRLPADRIAAAISVISADQLAATHAVDPGQTTNQMAGVLMTNLGPGRDKLLVRGLSDGVFTGTAQATVGTYLDNAPINYNAPDPDLRLTDISRVEVVRGPQGALYGDGALAGVYRIVTRKPDLATYEAGLSATIADTRGGSPSRSVEAYANLPLVRERAALRITAYHDIQGGYLDDIALRRTNVDRTLRDGGRAALRLQTAPGWTVDLSGAWQNLASSDTQYTTAPLLSRRRANRIAEQHVNRFGEGALTLNGQVAGANLTSTTAFIRHDFASLYDATAALDLFADPSLEVGVYTERRRVRMLVEDLVLSSRGHSRFGWLAGIYAAGLDELSPSLLQALPSRGPLTTLYADYRKDRLRALAAYGEAIYQLAPGLTLAAGGRLLEVSQTTASAVKAPRPGVSRAFRARDRFAAFAPKLSIQHEFGAGLVYVLYSTDYRAGGLNTAGLYPLPRIRTRFAPDRLRNYEAGVKLHGFERRLSLRAAAFFDQWRDIQTDRYLASGLAYTANVGDAEIRGLEAEVGYAFAGGLSLKGDLLLTKARFTRRNPDFAARLSGALPGTPPGSGGIVAIYQRPLTARLTARFSAQAAYIGRSRLTFDAAGAPQMGGYLDAELTAGLAGRRWAADLFLTNPANSSADTFAYGNPFSFGQVRQATPLRPRTLGLTLSAKF